MTQLSPATLVGLDEILQEFKRKGYSAVLGEEALKIAGDVPTAIFLIETLESSELVDPKWVESGRPPAMIFLKPAGKSKIESGGFTGKLK